MNKMFNDVYVGGTWSSTADQFPDFNPADDSIWAYVPDGDRQVVRKAIEAAQAAFPEWAGLTHSARANYMNKVAEVFERRKMELVEAIQAEGGGWFGKGMYEAAQVPIIFRAAAGANYGAIGEVLPSEHGKFSMAVRYPLGVVSIVSPWNFPAILTARSLAFIVALGNTVVLKPSEETPYVGGLLFAEIFEEAGIPPGVLNVVTCSRDNVQEVGDEMIENPAVKAIAFTGSTAVGRSIAAKAGAHLKKCCIELGGKDPMIVCEDADLDRAVQAANFGSFMHQGQICMSVEKLLVHDSIFDTFLDRFVERASKLKVGPPLADKANVIGPLINDKQVANVQSQLDDAFAKGAKAVLGGKINGRFVDPTILVGVTPDMKVYREETFGPVAPVIPFHTDEEAIAIANDSPYGLSSGVFTENEKRGLNIAHKLESGMSHINCSPVNDEANAPFGGSKSSGVGRYGGRWSAESYTETRWITMERGGKPYPPVF
ncbi:MAG: aldehyde dehydrogenase family protein [Rhodospirillales bacterium]|nr:aldehyde dehydrogenase family protein [Rhodospirillales bacterium]